MIAKAFSLAHEGLVAMQEPITTIELEFEFGVLPVDIHIVYGHPGGVLMTEKRPTFGQTSKVHEVASSLGLRLQDLRSDCLPQIVGTGVPFLFHPVREPALVGEVDIGRKALAAVCRRAGVSAALTLSLGGFGPQSDTHAQSFDPEGTMEDPLAGSATGATSAYVIHHALKSGHHLVAEQSHFVERPGTGIDEVRRDNRGIGSIRLGGAIEKVIAEEFLIPGDNGDEERQ